MNESSKSPPWLSPGQSKLFALTICSASLFVLVWLLGWLVHSLGVFIEHFSAVLWPLAVASILAILLRPFARLIEERVGLSRNSSVFILFAMAVSVGAFVSWGIGGEVIRQSRDLAGSSLEWPERIEARIKQTVSPQTWSVFAQEFNQFKHNWKETLGKWGSNTPELTKGSARVLQNTWTGLGVFFSSLASLAVVPIYLFYFMSSRSDHLASFARQLKFLGSDTREDVIYLIRQFKDILETFFRGQLLIGFFMGIGYAVGFSLSGLKFGITLGLVFGILNVVPYLGSVLGIIGAFLVAYLQPGGILETGTWGILTGCAITFTIVQIFESYWLSPRVMGERTGLHPVIIIASVFFWGTALGGVLGMIMGIPLTAFLIVLWRLVRQKYI